MQVYNSSEPPDYDLEKVQVPVSVFYAENDVFSAVKVNVINLLFYNFIYNSFIIFNTLIDLLINSEIF